MGNGKITLYLDIVSPFGYMGYYMLRHHSAFANVEKTYVPMFLGGLMKMCGNVTPISITNKRDWISIERIRWSKHLSIPMTTNLPAGFPIMTIAPQRALCYISAHHPTYLVPSIDALYASMWANGDGSVGKPEGFEPILAEVLPKDVVEDVMKNFAGAEAKKMLNGNTDLAMGKGAFGLPWFECENSKGEKECFWGVDHLGQVMLFMGLEKSGDLRALL